MKDKIRVLYKPVDGPAEIRTIPNTLKAVQGLVEGYFQPVRLFGPVVVIVNEEGLVRGMKKNEFAGMRYFGPWFVCGADGEDFTDVPDLFLDAVKHFGVKFREEADDV